MANEYLRRTFTSTGNLKEGTFSFWMKGRSYNSVQPVPVYLYDGSNLFQMFFEGTGGTNPGFIVLYTNAGVLNVRYRGVYRDPSSWSHYLVKVDNTINGAEARFEVYVNGVRLEIVGSQTGSTAAYPARDANIFNNVTYINGSSGSGAFEIFDYFFIDGQALTPDVFGFYKQGKGYISVGSTQATDFRPGQWVPKTPRVIKTEINRRGGFGVNGFYLPMNDSNNFGADFHGEPNSIITLNEKLPQPRVGVATTASVGLGYTDALRADPYAANLVLALPFVSSGLTTGTDYASYIKGSGTAKTITNNGVSIASTASHYGSAAFFNGSTQYLSIADSDDFNFGSGNFTIECWINPSTTVNTTSYRRILSQQQLVGGGNWIFRLDNQGVFQTNFYDGSNSVTLTTGARIDTLGQWTHIAVVRNGNTLANYINGVCAGIATNMSITIPDISATIEVGRYVGGSEYYVGYLQDLRVYKGVAKYTGGFDVPRPYTPVGIATWRAVPDTTANNFATWTPNSGFIGRNSSNVRAGSITLTDGNLTWYRQQNSIPIYSTANVRTGKWYWEYLIRGNTRTSYGIVQTPHDGGFGVEFGNVGDYAYMHEGGQTKIINGSSSSAGSYFASVPAVNDIVGVAYDANTGQLWFSKNGTFGNSGNPASGTNALITGITTDTQYNFAVFGAGDYPSSDTLQGSTNFGQNPSFSGNTTAGTFTDSNSKGLFKYQPPSGFLALCEDNLPTPAISDPGKYFKTVLYTGDGNNGRSIVGVGFTPDLVWIKGRNNATYDQKVWDSVRGPLIQLEPSSTQQEVLVSNSVVSFNSDGFSVGSYGAVNLNASSQVAWCWRAGAGTTSTNTNGSITSVVSVNQDAGFSIVSYTGTGASNATVGHGLGKVPAFGVVKCRDTNSVSNEWRAQHKGLTSGYYIVLSSTAAQAQISATSFGSLGTFTSSSTVTLQAGSSDSTTTNESGKRYIMYLWAEIEGYSKFGSYVGNGSADGPFVYCGFKPAFVLIKRATGGTGNWAIFDNSRDSTNPVFGYLVAESSAVEERGTAVIDFTSNGFKIRNSWTTINSSGDTIIFAAFAESPFQTANSK
jgi:hypothetical protein